MKMRLATFKQYAPILIELNKALNNDERLNISVKQRASVKQVKQSRVKHCRLEYSGIRGLFPGIQKKGREDAGRLPGEES